MFERFSVHQSEGQGDPQKLGELLLSSLSKVNIALPCVGEVAERVALSAGTCRASVTKLAESYNAHSIIPLPEWRIPNASEVNAYDFRTHDFQPGRDVGIVSIPERQIEIAHKLGLNSVSNPLDLRGLSQDGNLETYLSQLTETLLQWSGDTSRLKVLGLNISKPNCWTATTDHNECGLRKHVGLHIDSWTNFSANDRCNAPNRIAVNLGVEDRYFLFIDRTVADLYRLLTSIDPALAAPHLQGGVIGYEFLNLFPNYPVTRLRVKPGEAYIAPTENIVHDGSTAGTSSMDVTFSMMGDFKPVVGS